MPRSITDYNESTNLQIDMIHDVFIDRFEELNIIGKLNVCREHSGGLLGYITVSVLDIDILILRTGQDKYCIRYLNTYNVSTDESELNSHCQKVFREALDSDSFDSFSMFPVEMDCGRGLYGQTNAYQLEVSVESEINSISIWGFTQYIFEIWKDLYKLLRLMGRSL